MLCKMCGKNISRRDEVCPYCRAVQSGDGVFVEKEYTGARRQKSSNGFPSTEWANNDNIESVVSVVCPICGSENCKSTGNAPGRERNIFSTILKMLLGFWFCGPIGILCGFCGNNSGNVYYKCDDCGAMFK